MTTPTLIYYEVLEYLPENIALINENFHVISLKDPSYDEPDILKQADVILAPLGHFIGKEKIDLSPKLKVIGSNTTGHPHIDIEYAKQRGVKVVTLKNEHGILNSITSTAELTWGLIIDVTRNVFPAFKSVLDGKWTRWPFGGKQMLSRMSLGVVGAGRLGSMVARYGVCFSMKVQCFDPNVSSVPDGSSRAASLKELARSSDIVTVHVPHEPETEKLFDKDLFSEFKTGAYFINTSRGELVDHNALLHCLESNKLAGAAVDVIEGEFDTGFGGRVLEQPLVRYAKEHSNLIITPHIGGSTVDAWSLTQKHTIDKVIEALGRENR